MFIRKYISENLGDFSVETPEMKAKKIRELREKKLKRIFKNDNKS